MEPLHYPSTMHYLLTQPYTAMSAAQVSAFDSKLRLPLMIQASKTQVINPPLILWLTSQLTGVRKHWAWRIGCSLQRQDSLANSYMHTYNLGQEESLRTLPYKEEGLHLKAIKKSSIISFPLVVYIDITMSCSFGSVYAHVCVHVHACSVQCMSHAVSQLVFLL